MNYLKKSTLVFVLSVLILIPVLLLGKRSEQNNSAKPTELTQKEWVLSRNRQIQKNYSQNPHSALVIAQKNLELSRELNFKKGEATSLRILGLIHNLLGHHTIALTNFQKSKGIAREINDDLLVVLAYKDIGNIYFKINDYDNALKYFTLARQYNNEHSKPFSKLMLLHSIARTYSALGDLDKAFQTYKRALNSITDSSNHVLITKFKVAIAKTLMDKQDYEKALQLERDVVAFYQNSPHREDLAIAYNDIGWIYYKLGNFDKAIKNNKLALDLRQELKPTTLVGSSERNLGFMYQEWGKYALAEKYFFKSLETLRDKKEYYSIIYKSLSYKGLYEIASTNNNFKEALTYYKKYSVLQDSIQSMQNTNELKNIQSKFELKEIRQVNQMFQLEIQHKNLMNGLLIGVLAFLTILVIFLYYIYNMKRKTGLKLENLVLKRTKKLEDEIEVRKNAEERLSNLLEEKKVMLQEIHHRVKNNLQLVISLINLQLRNSNNKDVKETFNKCNNRIRSMAMIHEDLYKSDDFANISLPQYIRHLCTNLIATYKEQDKSVELIFEVEDVKININLGIPLGLILNELITNAIKHGFSKNRGGWIKISLHKEEDDQVKLTVGNNGKSIPEDYDIEKTDSLGMELVSGLIAQTDGKIKFERKPHTKFTITFPVS